MRKEILSNIVLPILVIGILAAVLTTVLSEAYRPLGVYGLYLMIPIAAGLMGYLAALSKPKVKPIRHQAENNAADPVDPTDSLAHHLTDLLRYSVQMLTSQDLIERYHSFNELTERLYCRLTGRSSVSLWCPDSSREMLIECVSGMNQGTGETRVANHTPSQIPLKGECAINALETGKPYIVPDISRYRTENQEPDAWQASVPLVRKYGQPLLAMIEWVGYETLTASQKKELKARFHHAAEISQLFWQQLQAINERQWQMEHDEFSRTLRADVFVERGQEWADQCIRKDDPFSVVVLSIRGFRRLFAGQSQTWNQISGLIGGKLGDILNRSGKAYLLGRMADDVFALIMPRTDTYLASQIMQSGLKTLNEEIGQTRQSDFGDILSIDLAWMAADKRLYQGRLSDMLDRIYRSFFNTDRTIEHRHEFRLTLHESPVEAV